MTTVDFLFHLAKLAFAVNFALLECMTSFKFSAAV